MYFSASIVAHGTDAFGHVLPVKCTVNCDPVAPTVTPVLSHPLINTLYGIRPIAPEPEAAPEEASPAPAAEDTPANLPVYHKGFYGGLAPLAPHWGAWNWANCDHGNWGAWNHGVWGPWGHGAWGHGAIATGPVDINGDGSAYTGHEDDRSPITGGHVYQTLQGETTWHGPHYGALAHVPVGPYGPHHNWEHYPWGYLGHLGGVVPAAVAPVADGEEKNGPIFPFGHYANFHGYPWAGHYGWNHALPPYTIGDIKNVEIKKEDCPEGVVLPHLVFDKSVKPVEEEAAPVADEAAADVVEAAPAS